MENLTKLNSLESEIITCHKCERLTAWREEVGILKRRAYRDEEYWAKPVPGFGDPDARILILGLAPGAHGSNRTGRMFTGDASGDFLFPALFRSAFANQPQAVRRGDGLVLKDVFISAVCRCVPPGNKPTAEEVENCREYLLEEIKFLSNLQGIVTLGKIAHVAAVQILRTQGWVGKPPEFGHGSLHIPDGNFPWLLGSYHPSRQNTQTGRLKIDMFDQIWKKAGVLIK